MPLKTPLVLQMEAVECGAAVLGIVLEYYGRVVPLSELRVECGVSRDGSRASSILRAARRYGLEAKGFKKSLDLVRQVKFPAIVFWNFNHFVVLEGFRGGRAFINDPASGRREVTLEEFDRAFTGVVLILEPGPEFTKGGARPSVTAALRRNLRGSYTGLAYCVLAGLFLVVPGMGFPVLTQVFVDSVVIGGRYSWLGPLVAALVGVIAIQGALLYLQYRHLVDLRVKLSVGMSSRFLSHVLRLPIGFFSQRFSGEVCSRIGLNDEVAELLAGRLARTLIDCVMILFYAGLMLWYDPFLTAVGVGAALLNVLLLRVVSRARKAANMREQQEAGKLHGVAIAGLQSIETLKASAQESSFFSRWGGHYAKSLNAKQSLALADQALGVVPGFLAGFAALLVLVVGGARVIDGAMTVGMLIAFRGLLAGFQRPVDTLVDMAGGLQTLEGDLVRLDDVLREERDPLAEPRVRVADEAPRLEGHVACEALTFGYTPGAPPLIEEFSLVVAPGQRVALVGPSGSGKSTLARLIAGLQLPWQGRVLLDGRRHGHIPRRVLASSLALVEQDPSFFAGTVHDNLTLWDPTVTGEQLDRAARDAEVHELILSLPGGYGAELSEGAGNLSGGERQRLEIARALVQDPSLLLLDEATSCLDAEVERKIDRNLRVRGCTCVVIAHRLSTIRDCDEIVVLDRGRVVERGTYEALSRSGGALERLLEDFGEVDSGEGEGG